MLIPFAKMHGCGNDYIFFDGFLCKIDDPGGLAIRLCDRNRGVGGGGLVVTMPSTTADAAMRMYNPDGTESSMSGDAIRCVGKYLYEMGRVSAKDLRIETKSGVKDLLLFTDGEPSEVYAVRVDMGAAGLLPQDVPVSLPGEAVIGREIVLNGTAYEITCVSMGNPHAVYFHDDIDHLDMAALGPVFETAEIFPRRTNFAAAQIIGRGEIKMRAWERGAGLTLASGTGACAAAVAAVEMGYADRGTDITVHQAGGTLIVRYTADTVYMTGEAVNIFVGAVAI